MDVGPSHAADLLFLAWSPEPGREPEGELRRAYAELRAELEASGAVLLHERVFAPLGAAPQVLGVRRQALAGLDEELALDPTVVEGRPCDGSPFAGLHAIAARPAPGAAHRLIQHRGRVVGREVEGREASFAGLRHLTRGAEAAGGPAPGLEAEALMAAAEAALGGAGWSWAEVRRTWFFLRDILSWYPEFNRARNAAFERLGLLNGPGAGLIPSSTGIGGRGSDGSWCTADLLAIRGVAGSQFAVRRLANPVQNEAPDYGSSFSRGLEVATGRSRYVFVSGTAAIDRRGRSRHPDSFETQTVRTLDTVEALLAAAGASFADVAQATLFVKHGELAPAARRILDRRGLEALPAVWVEADVCRPELLFEVDATAVLPVVP